MGPGGYPGSVAGAMTGPGGMGPKGRVFLDNGFKGITRASYALVSLYDYFFHFAFIL